MRIGLLGPVEVWDAAGQPVALSGVRLRTLLARLALAPGNLVTSAALVDAVWPDGPPAGPAHALQSLVSRLRRSLPADLRVDGRPAGYALVVDPDEVDIGRFERLTATGRAAAARGDAAAAGHLTEALGLWRGAALADLGDSRFAGPVVARLAELRLRTVEDLAGVLGPDELAGRVAELAELSAAHPLRERTRALHMRALRAAGRSTEALAAFAELRQALAESLGTDPSPELRDLNTELLQGTPDPPAGNLRSALTSFVGRESELSRVDEALDAGRLVTLVGPGGAGKTRLAVEVAARRSGRAADGVWLVELAGVTDPGEVAAAVLATLGRDGHRETSLLGRGEPSRTPLGRLAEAVRDRQLLIVLDNCEHLLDACAQVVAAVLGAAPQVSILATTREPLAITGEALIPVGPLPLPPSDLDPVDAVVEFAAVRLFADRMAAVRPGLTVTPENVATVVEVCRRLDGLPLAIELACARLRTLPLAEIAARLSDRFRLLTGGSRTALPRHQTLLAVVGWSWDLFGDAERSVARRLAVFAGGASLAAIEAVCPDIHRGEALELVSALVDKSFVELSETPPRYRMLDTVRAYAAAELAASGEADRTRAAHAAHFLGQVELADPALRTGDQLIWLAWLEREYDNISAALRWAVDAGQAETAARLVVALGWYWVLNGDRDEAVGWLTAVLAMPDTRRTVAPATLAIAYAYDAIHHFSIHDLDRAHSSATAARDLVRDEPAWHPAVAFVTVIVSVADFELATVFAALSGLAEHPEPWVAAAGRLVRGHAAETFGDVAGAGEQFALARQAFAALGDRWGIMMAVSALAGSASLRGDHAGAIAAYTEAEELSTAVAAADDATWARARRGLEHLRAGALELARVDLVAGHAEALSRRSAALTAMAEGGLAELARASGDLPGARVLLERAMHRVEGAPGALPPRVRVILLTGLGRTATAAHVQAAPEVPPDQAVEAGEADQAAGSYLARALGAALEIGDRPMVASVAEAMAELAVARARPAPAARLLGLAAAVRGAVDQGSPEVRATVAAGRAALGKAAWAASYDEAVALPPEAVIAELAGPPAPAPP